MILQEINHQLDQLYCTGDRTPGIRIGTWHTIEGDPINFYFYQEDEKYAKLVTNENFSGWMQWCTDGQEEANAYIDRLAGIYGVKWDREHQCLFLRFRRNEMTLAQAILRLQQAVFVVGSVEYH